MARCPNCHRYFLTPPGEEQDHDCPHCGLRPEDVFRRDEEEKEETEGEEDELEEN